MKKTILLIATLLTLASVMAFAEPALTFYPNAEVGVKFSNGLYFGLFGDDTFTISNTKAVSLEPKVTYRLPIDFPISFTLGAGCYTVFSPAFKVGEVRPRFDVIAGYNLGNLGFTVRERLEVRNTTNTVLRDRVRAKVNYNIKCDGFTIVPTISDELYITSVLDKQDFEAGIGVKIGDLFVGVGNYFTIDKTGYSANNAYAQVSYLFNIK